MAGYTRSMSQQASFSFHQNLEPLSSSLRPSTLEDFVGQKHLVGEKGVIGKLLRSKRIISMIFYGPPGCGKTSLAKIVSNTIDGDFYHLSGVISKKEDVLQVVAKAKANFSIGKTTVLFLDEIHRWNKAQQDSLLPFVEKGIVILIGATTENPSFTINNALLSRAKTVVFEPVSSEDVLEFFQKKIHAINRRYPKIEIPEETLQHIAKIGNGDLRYTINLLEECLLFKEEGTLAVEDVEREKKPLYFDRDGEEHYNLISALHKSVRDSDADAACYWTSRMLAGGEDPRYLARRMIRMASEDIGIADPSLFPYAISVHTACEQVGMPECELFLLELAYLLSKAPKSNLVYKAMYAIQADVDEYGNAPVPHHIRNAPTSLMKEWGYGKGYKYAHDYPDAKVDQEHFPDVLKGRKYFK